MRCACLTGVCVCGSEGVMVTAVVAVIAVMVIAVINSNSCAGYSSGSQASVLSGIVWHLSLVRRAAQQSALAMSGQLWL
jgi:hypothetical protein